MSIPLGDPVPEFALRGVDGREHSSGDYEAARFLVLVQSCNHCPYVLAWEDRLIAIQADYRERGVELVAFNSNDAARYPDDSFEQMVVHAQQKGFNFDYLHDPEQLLASALDSERTPEIFAFDRDRKLVYHGAVDDNRDEDEVGETYLRDALDALLAGSDPSPADTPPVGCTVKWLP